MIEERKSTTINQNIVQNIVLENREKLNVSGVNDVLSFDDQVVMIDTELGLLTVKGENIRINKLSLDTSEVIVDGEIRIYMILGILIGAVIYTLTLSTIFIKINYFIMSKIKIILTFISKIFKIPIKFINNILNKLKKLIKFKEKKGEFGK